VEGDEERGHLYSAEVQAPGGAGYLFSEKAYHNAVACEYFQLLGTAEKKGSICVNPAFALYWSSHGAL
jgi:hypothetical protein